MKIDIVIQGTVDETTLELINECKRFPIKNNIILSSYETNLPIPDDIIFVKNDVIDPPGIGNRNLHINTTKNGLAQVTTKYCLKLRSDQILTQEGFREMISYWWKREKINDSSLIYVLSLCPRFPYCTRDHVYLGKTSNIKKLFNCPFDMGPQLDFLVRDGYSPIYDYRPQAETYLGMWYFALHDPEVAEQVKTPELYMANRSPFRDIAMKKSSDMINNLFAPLPPISMKWPKFGLNSYPYHWIKEYGEIWAEPDTTIDEFLFAGDSL